MANIGNRKIKIPQSSFRNLVIDETSTEIKDDGRLIFSFSSEQKVRTYWGDEILSHDEGAVLLERINSSGILLFNHNRDEYIGVVEKAWVQDKKGRAEVRFSNNETARKVKADVDAKILRNISVGYSIKELKLVEEGDVDTFMATKWEPYEISIVTIPADVSIGIGRSANVSETEITLELRTGEENERDDDEEIDEENERDDDEETDEEKNNNKKTTSTTSVVVETEERSLSIKIEKERIQAIHSLGERHGMPDLAKHLIDTDADINAARTAFLEKMEQKQEPFSNPGSELELTEREKKGYSLVRALNALMTNDWSKAGFERECSIELAKRSGKDTSGFFLPTNIRAAYATGATATGGALVQTDVLTGSFIELLRNKMLLPELGATFLTGLEGNVSIPKQLTTANAYWITENADITESEGTFGSVTMSPKTVAGMSQISRNMLIQPSMDIEAMVRNDLALVLALAIDAAAFSGSGAAGQPKGILNHAGIGSHAMGVNGAALINADPLIDLETLVAIANADFGSLAYVTNPNVIGKLKKLKDEQGQYLWNTTKGFSAAVPGEINGYKAARSNQIASNLTKGTGTALSALLFGNFADLVIGQWGPSVEITANPFGDGFKKGALDVRAMASVDVAVRNEKSFAAITDIL